MQVLETLDLPSGTLQIGTAEPDDLAAVLTVFDEAVAGMNARGNTKQWGTEFFSQIPRVVERFTNHLRDDRVCVAARNGRIVGVIVITFHPPPYCWQDTTDEAAYVEPFATSPTVRGEGVGRLLLERAEQYTREQSKARLRLDCFAEIPTLPAYYEAAGFMPCGDFTVKDWHGRMFEKTLAP